MIRRIHFFMHLVFVLLGVAACSPGEGDESVVRELDCTTDTGECSAGYTYTPNGPNGRRLGEYANFGNVGDFGRGPVWSAQLNSNYQPGGCLVFGPYESFPHAYIDIVAEIDIEGVTCNGRTGACGDSYWSGYSSQEYDDSHHTGANSFVVDMVMDTPHGHVTVQREVRESNKSIPFETIRLGTGRITDKVSRLEVRVCDLKVGSHKWIRNCTTNIHGIEHCTRSDHVNTFRVSASGVRINALYDTTP